MCTAAAVPWVIAAISAASTTYGAIQQNQQIQHAKGAQEAQVAEQQKQIEEQKKVGPVAKAVTFEDTTDVERRRRIRALQSGIASTIATSPTGTKGTPTLITPTAGGANLKLKLGV